jgi:hypothetical protein
MQNREETPCVRHWHDEDVGWFTVGLYRSEEIY